MKALFLIAALAAGQPTPSTIAHAACDVVASAAETVMGARQAGVSMSDTNAVAHKHFTRKQLLAIDRIILRAYALPRWHTEELQQFAVQEFRNEYHVACLLNR